MKAESGALLDIRDLKVQYWSDRGMVRAVDGVSLRIAPGEVFGLAGESGSGKSTVAMTIMRVLHPPAEIAGGMVLLEGRDLLELEGAELESVRWRTVSMVFQSAMNALNPVMRVGDQIVDAILAHEKVGRSEARQRSVELLALTGIEAARARAYPHELSGGMRQRVMIAMALALRPRLIIMDEPTTGLDVVVQREIMQQIQELKDRLGFSILFITHDLSLLMELCSRAAIMYAGKVVEEGPVATLFSHPIHPYTEGLMNCFPSVAGERRDLTGIVGSPPDMARPPTGCRFHPRCPYALEECRGVEPRLVPVARDRLAACHLSGVRAASGGGGVRDGEEARP
ncbi:MAG TPA: ABC transporter ATP-binding protein [Candidatus Dormibacteraeota bacterium]|jgi:peptide/nickel transport system ATP-binding protein|nr:ABC transporter ATP-binding protein [Candidatus Dormibacteraeota bacterium]